jgi:hypothetical protein
VGSDASAKQYVLDSHGKPASYSVDGSKITMEISDFILGRVVIRPELIPVDAMVEIIRSKIAELEPMKNILGTKSAYDLKILKGTCLANELEPSKGLEIMGRIESMPRMVQIFGHAPFDVVPELWSPGHLKLKQSLAPCRGASAVCITDKLELMFVGVIHKVYPKSKTLISHEVVDVCMRMIGDSDLTNICAKSASYWLEIVDALNAVAVSQHERAMDRAQLYEQYSRSMWSLRMRTSAEPPRGTAGRKI